MKSYDTWKSLSPESIPSSLDLFPVIFNYISPVSRILDLGCGAGRTCAALFNKGYFHIYGADMNPAATAASREKLAGLGLAAADDRFKISGKDRIPFPGGFFDCTICQALWTSVLAEDRAPLMKDICRVLLPGGILYIADFVRSPEFPLYRDRYSDGVAKGYDEGTFEVTGEDGELKFLAHHFTIDEFDELFRSAGLRPVHHQETQVRTHTGNLINGVVILAVKPQDSGMKAEGIQL